MFEKIKSLFKKEKKSSRYVSCEYIQHGFNVDYEDIITLKKNRKGVLNGKQQK